MAEQKQTSKPGSERKKEEIQRPLLSQVDSRVTEVSASLQAAEATIDAIDAILADFVSAEEPTERIGGKTTPRPQLRARSSEEFIKAFRQQTGQ